MSHNRVERAYEKYAWVIFTVIGLLTFVGGVPHMLGNNGSPEIVESFVGMTVSEFKASNPNFYGVYDYYFRGGGLSDMAFSFFVIFISATLFRKGDKLGWYMLWSVPAFFLGHAAIALNFGEPTSSLTPFLALFLTLSLLGLLLPIRRFFPKETHTRASEIK